MRGTRGDSLPYPARFAVLGGGSFGLALTTVLARKNIPTTVLVRKQEVADSINKNRTHPVYLKGVTLPTGFTATTDPQEALADATFLVHAIPVQHTRSFLMNHRQYFPPGAPILSLSKGIECGTLQLMEGIFEDVLGTDRALAFMSGPSFAREMALNQETAVVIASRDNELALDLAEILSGETYRCYTTKDVVGLEVGGACKNVVALAAGMCEGLGLGTNAKAGLVTRGCNEATRLAVKMGGKASTLGGLSGVGDTFATCFGPLSRNRKFGERLGKGETMEQILASSTEVAEGVETAFALRDLIYQVDKSYRVDLKYPILLGVARVLEGKITPYQGLKNFMAIPIRDENI
eukprot:CAMPEP_0113944294 /NCGR_PEP_ID=MMETSP1339-20121228/32794_1 /TAXON_ID=94617 /ORGANISM="Fibrocapsa japonica" /LENGTH=349 /DNA_ID=CAMNT_0000949451 /DNA_START=185 /DNA_END=1234 /DNA_ORIENTATION=+ /assembly_acc=CAM_ASM_000762